MQIHSTLTEVRAFLALPVTKTLAQIKQLAGVASWRTFADLKHTLLATPIPAQPKVLDASPDLASQSVTLSLEWDGTSTQVAGAKFQLLIDGELMGTVDALVSDGHDQVGIPWPGMPLEDCAVVPGDYLVTVIWVKGALKTPSDPANSFTMTV